VTSLADEDHQGRRQALTQSVVVNIRAGHDRPGPPTRGAGGGCDPGHCPAAPMPNSVAGVAEAARVASVKVRRVFRMWTAGEGGRAKRNL
jgi:hypothetical protein